MLVAVLDDYDLQQQVTVWPGYIANVPDLLDLLLWTAFDTFLHRGCTPHHLLTKELDHLCRFLLGKLDPNELTDAANHTGPVVTFRAEQLCLSVVGQSNPSGSGFLPRTMLVHWNSP